MADNVQFQSTTLATPASGTTVSTDDTSSGHVQRIKLTYSADGADTHVQADADGLLVNTGAHLDTMSATLDDSELGIATKAGIYGYTTSGGGQWEAVKVTPSGALTVEVNDGGGSITVDGSVSVAGTATVGGTVASTQSGAWTVTANAGTGPFPVSDNGGSLTVDGTVSVNGTVSTSVISASTATLTNINDTAASTALLASNADRKGFAIYNDSTSALYVKFGTSAASSAFTVKIESSGYYELVGHGVYTGPIDGVWVTDASGAARVTEW
jgi:hypothetical protein